MVQGSLKDVEISIVGLNAGLAIPGSVQEISDDKLEDVIRVNALHPIYLGKVLIEKMMVQSIKSAIIVTSSGLANIYLPNVASYNATKAFVSNFFQGVHYEV